jgi:hypothetical protein
MSYARVLDDIIAATGFPPDLLPPEDVTAGDRWWDLRQHDQELADWEALIADHGWLPIVAAERPPDTETDTSDYSLELIDGVPTEVWTVRPWTQEELDAKNAAIYGSPQAITNAILREYSSGQDPASAPPWVQPTGAHDAYLPGALVAHDDTTWRNDLTILNSWEPGTLNGGWFDLAPPSGEPEPWVQPTGSHDSYNVGDLVTHNGSTWVSDVAGNVWEPGVYGWTVQ